MGSWQADFIRPRTHGANDKQRRNNSKQNYTDRTIKAVYEIIVEETAAVYEYPFYNQEKTMGIEQLSSLFWEESTQDSFRMKALLFNAEPGTDVSVSAESDVWLKVRYKQFILTRTMIVVVRGIKAGGTIRIID